MMMQKKKNQKGFTLVELVIVLAIIGVLIGIAIPIYNNVLSSAETKADNSNIAMIEDAVLVYKADTGSYPVATDFSELITELNTKGYIKQNSITPNQENCEYVYDAQKHTVTLKPTK